MFRIGFWELMIILVFIIILIKPDNIPNFVRKAGRLLGQVKRSYDQLTDIIRKLDTEVKEAGKVNLSKVYKDANDYGLKKNKRTIRKNKVKK